MKRRGLTPDEGALWRRATRDVAPFRAAPDEPAREDRPPGLSKPAPVLPAAGKGPVLAPRPSLRPGRAPDPFQAGDPRLDRHVSRGRMAIDGVIDLHGHTQVTARATLLSFLAGAQARGRRCILVITGKGAPEPGENRHRPGGGVLRARLRDWLQEDAFRALVVRASPAHARHGGGGAFYLFLKTLQPGKK